jgi:putative restriction endonuclease
MASFSWLEEQTGFHGVVLSRELLAQGFLFNGQRVPLLGPQGIFKPALLPEIPLSITTVPVVEGRPRPYDDTIGEEGVLSYKYRGTDPAHRDNVGLRLAMKQRTPLIYLYGLVPGRYMPQWPVFIVGDDPRRLVFTVAVDDMRTMADADASSAEAFAVSDPGEAGRRAYVTRLTRQRLHQQAFRERVLRAYSERCAICRLRHEELLDAAHILPDGHPKGEPVVPNGLALCKLHHAAFDRNFLGIRPDRIVVVRSDLLREPDGPMLRHGLQEFEGARIRVPSRQELQPNREFLEERFAMFRRAV